MSGSLKGQSPIRKVMLGAIGLAVLSSGSLAAQKPITYMGEIMDSECAKIGSHDKMIDSGRLKDAEKCTLACVKNGGTFVLFDTTTKVVYLLDNQKKPRTLQQPR